ncbi:MAG: cytochrome P450 [Elainellaceae cyanobacterium]
MPTPPGSLGLPVIGETLAFFREPQFAQKRHQKYGPVFKTRLLGKPTIFLKGPDALHFVLTNENKYFVVSWPPSVKALLGPCSLALQTGHTHIQRRRLLVQAFQPRALAGYIPTVEQISDRYLQRWLQQQPLTWYPELRDYTLDIACKLFVGLDRGSQSQLGELFEIWCGGLFSIPLRLPWTAFGRAQKAREQLLTELERLIRDRQRQLEQGENLSQDDALSLLLQATDDDGTRLSLDELKDQVLLLLFAGHETLTSAVTNFCLLMAQHPKVKARAQAEQAVFAGQPLTLDGLRQMTYLDQVTKEVLRFLPPVGGGFRNVLQPCSYGGYDIPKDWAVLYQINSTHADAAVFAHADRFDPDRFSPERAEDKAKPFSHVPFGGGLRECLGKEFARLELKIFAVKLLQGYDWTLLPDQNLEMTVTPTPHPKDGLRVTFSQQ